MVNLRHSRARAIHEVCIRTSSRRVCVLPFSSLLFSSLLSSLFCGIPCHAFPWPSFDGRVASRSTAAAFRSRGRSGIITELCPPRMTHVPARPFRRRTYPREGWLLRLSNLLSVSSLTASVSHASAKCTLFAQLPCCSVLTRCARHVCSDCFLRLFRLRIFSALASFSAEQARAAVDSRSTAVAAAVATEVAAASVIHATPATTGHRPATINAVFRQSGAQIGSSTSGRAGASTAARAAAPAASRAPAPPVAARPATGGPSACPIGRPRAQRRTLRPCMRPAVRRAAGVTRVASEPSTEPRWTRASTRCRWAKGSRGPPRSWPPRAPSSVTLRLNAAPERRA